MPRLLIATALTAAAALLIAAAYFLTEPDPTPRYTFVPGLTSGERFPADGEPSFHVGEEPARGVKVRLRFKPATGPITSMEIYGPIDRGTNGPPAACPIPTAPPTGYWSYACEEPVPASNSSGVQR